MFKLCWSKIAKQTRVKKRYINDVFPLTASNYLECFWSRASRCGKMHAIDFRHKHKTRNVPKNEQQWSAFTYLYIDVVAWVLPVHLNYDPQVRLYLIRYLRTASYKKTRIELTSKRTCVQNISYSNSTRFTLF